MNLPDFASGYWPIILATIFFGVISFRYFLVAGIFYVVFYNWFRKKYASQKINRPASLKKKLHTASSVQSFLQSQAQPPLFSGKKAILRSIQKLIGMDGGICRQACYYICFCRKRTTTGFIGGCISQRFSGWF